MDGSRVESPPLRPVSTEPDVQFGAEDKKRLENVIAKANAEIDRRNAARTGKYNYVEPKSKPSMAAQIIKLFNNAPQRVKCADNRRMWQFLNFEVRDTWTLEALSRMSQDRALRLAIAANHNSRAAFYLQEWGAMNAYIVRYLNSEGAD